MGNGATEFTLVIRPRDSVILTGRCKGARKYIQGGGLNYYVTGKIGTNWDYWSNVILRHAISQGRKALEMRRWL